MKLVIGTFLFSVASALIPILNVEAYLAVVATQLTATPAWALALIGGSGQVVGKIIWYYAGWHSLRFKWMQKKMEKPKWKASYDKWNARIGERPAMAGVICFASAFSGFPPLAVIAVLAGSLRVNFPVFVATCLVGRTLRFLAVLEGVGLFFNH